MQLKRIESVLEHLNYRIETLEENKGIVTADITNYGINTSMIIEIDSNYNVKFLSGDRIACGEWFDIEATDEYTIGLINAIKEELDFNKSYFEQNNK